MVILAKYINIIPSPAKKQKLDRTGSEEEQPTKKTILLVRVVIVREDPAFIMPIRILSFTLSNALV